MAEQIFQVGAKAIIRNEQGRLLLLKAAEYWDLPGGRLDVGETVEEALRRELHEEIGVTALESCVLRHVDLSVKDIPYGDMRTKLLLVVYDVSLAAGQAPVSKETGVDFGWIDPPTAAVYLADKYPQAFCQSLYDTTRGRL